MFRGLGIFSFFVLVGLIPNSAFAGVFTHPNDAAAAAKAYHRYGYEGNSHQAVSRRYNDFYQHLSRIHPSDPAIKTSRERTQSILTDMAKLREEMNNAKDEQTRSAKAIELAKLGSELEAIQEHILTTYKNDMEKVLVEIAGNKVAASDQSKIKPEDLIRALVDSEHQGLANSLKNADDTLLPEVGRTALKTLDDAFGGDPKSLTGPMKTAYEQARKGVIDYFRHEDPKDINMDRIKDFVHGMRAQAISLGGDDISLPGADTTPTHLTSATTGNRPIDGTYKRVGDGISNGNKNAVLSAAALTMRVGTPDMVRDFIDFFNAVKGKPEGETAGTALKKLHDAWVSILKGDDIGWDPAKGDPEPWQIMAAIQKMPEALQAILKGKSPEEVKAIIKTLVENRCPGSAFFDPSGLAALIGLAV
ncbi:MAG: hypothetical protein R3B54_17025 [Bdellovibrionota bacterium]